MDILQLSDLKNLTMMFEAFKNGFDYDSGMRLAPENDEWHSKRTIRFNKLLPYAEELDDEAQKLFADIKANLVRSVMLREIRPGCYESTVRLCKYIYLYGLNFSKEDHILLIKLIYELTTIPDLEPFLIYTFANTLHRLLVKSDLIRPDELELPWRPLYDQVVKVFDNKLINLGIYRSLHDMDTALDNVVHTAKIYFPLSATQEILDELRPKLCPYDLVTIGLAVRRLEWFLPVTLPPEHHSLGYELWFNEFMRLWEVCHNAPSWEREMMELMARLANKNIGYLDWEPYVPLMFTRFIRCLNLPVYFKNRANIKNHKIDSMYIAIWTVSVLGNGSSAQMYLDKFLKTVETYLHPANFGQWALKLMELIKRLCYYFVVRLHRERFKKPTWATPIPDSYKLTDSDVDAFVNSVLPLAMVSMFSKSFNISSNACYALQYLANVRPNLVVPVLLERVDATLESLIEPDRFTSLMRALSAVSRQLCQGSRNVNQGYAYAPGPAEVVPLLFSTLPGIDHNDFMKSQMVYSFITMIVSYVPLVDSSRCQAALDEDDRLVSESTSRFEDFILQFLDRIFILIESSSVDVVRQESDLAKSAMDMIAENILFELLSSMFCQSSDALFEVAVQKFRTFVIEKTQETKVAGQLVMACCKMFAKANSRLALPVLLPVLAQSVLDLVKEADDITKEENLDNRLLYTMLVLSGTLSATGNFILPYVDSLTNVLDKVLHLKSREGSDIAYQLLEGLFTSLCDVSLNKAYRNDRDYSNPECAQVLDWGQPVDTKCIETEWYIPGKVEISVAQKLFTKYLQPELERIEKFIADPNSLTREELLDSLSIVYEILAGCENLLPIWDEPPLILEPSVIEPTPFKLNLGIKGEIKMPDGSNVRHSLTKIITRLQDVMLKSAEDDIKSIVILSEIWQTILLGKFRLRGFYMRKNKVLRLAKKLWEDKLTNKDGNLVFYWDRIISQHEARVQYQTFVFTETHKHIMVKLLELSTSRYAKVRGMAQILLSDAMSYYPYSYKIVVPYLLDILGRDTAEHHEAYKGALYILTSPKHDLLVTKRDWSLVRSLWPAIVLAKPSEKPSVIALQDNIQFFIIKGFMTTQIALKVPESCVIAAFALWDASSKKVTCPIKEEIQKGMEMLVEKGRQNLENYEALLDELMSIIIEKNLHWRKRLIAMTQIKQISHPDQIYPLKVVKYFLHTLINESIFERQAALKIILCILKQQKKKHPKVDFDLSQVRQIDSGQEVLRPGERADNSWLQYNSQTRPLTVEQWNEPRFVHKLYIGYYTWPKKLQVYASNTEQFFNLETRELSDIEREIYNFFNDPQNVEKLIHYFSLEEKKGKEKFNCSNFLLFKFLFRSYGDVFLKHFLPHLKRLADDKQESSQRCASEIIAGLIQGTKHWPFEMVASMWEELIPIVNIALSNLSVDSIGNWSLSFAMAQKSLDPNRLHWLLESLMDESPLGESEGSLVECGRLYVLQSALTQMIWRVSELMHRLLTRLEDRLELNPFQILRNRLGSILVTIFEADIRFEENSATQTSPRAQNLIDKVAPKLQMLAENPHILSGENSLSSGVAGVRLNEVIEGENQTVNEEERTKAIKLFKTICKWMIFSINRAQYSVLPGYYEFLLIMCQLENCDTDDELTSLCSDTLAILARGLTMPKYMTAAFAAILKASRNTSWWVRATSLDFMQVFVFHNMSILLSKDEWVETVQEIVLRLLEDERLEVREKAGQVLGGLLHCAFIPDKVTLLEDFKVKSKTRIRKRKHQIAPDAEERANIVEINAIRRRHAGILGLCAFIQAHPYDIPSYVPSIFEHMGSHLNDPQPIPATIRKTLSNFKRTHYDGWSVHAQQFTEEQLEVLQDLTVPPSHYA